MSETAFTLLAAEGSHSTYRSRDTDVSVPAGLVSHAIDGNGRRHLLVPLETDAGPVQDVSSKGVVVETRTLVDAGTERRFIDVQCTDGALSDLFAILCDEMLAAISADPGGAAGACIRVLDRWRDLLGPPSQRLLGPDVLCGLLAELLVLEWLSSRDPVRAMQVWKGPDRLRHDFIGDAAIEVKATLRRDVFALQIHGLHQLELPAQGSLYLVAKKFEVVTTGGDSVPDAVDRLQALALPLGSILDGLSQSGYRAADAATYRQVRFALLEERSYLVDGDFPRITTDTVQHPATLQHVSNVRYSLDLSAEPPQPMTNEEVAAIPLAVLGA